MRLILLLGALAGLAASQLEPAAGPRTFLYMIQSGLLEMLESGEYFTLNSAGTYTLASGMRTQMSFAKTDLCRIAHPVAKNHESAVLGITCKADFVALYESDPMCGNFICDLLTWMMGDQPHEFFAEFMAATTDADAFRIIEERIYTPIMEWNCECTLKVIDTFMGCKSSIGEAKVLSVNMAGLANIDTNAPYQRGVPYTEYWVDVIDNQIPWDTIRLVADRFVSNLCNDDNEGEQCYRYFYGTVTQMYQWWLKSTGMKPAGRSSVDRRYPSSCTTFDLSVMEYGGFSDIKEALINKMCVDECSGLYQDVLFGCCTATMIMDNELSEGLTTLAEELKYLTVRYFGYDEEDINDDFTLYMGYATDSLDMLRNPTCDNGVSYEMTPCGEESSSVDDPCAGMKGRKKKKCMKDMEETDADTDADVDEGGDMSDPCAELKGKKKKKCMKMQESSGEGEGEEGEDPCAGLKGKKKKKCMKALEAEEEMA